MKTIYLDSIPSTNTYLKDHYNDYQHFDCLVTKNQTSGKGRLNNHWFSTENDLTFSILIKEDLSPSTIQLMPFYTAYIIHKVISSMNINALIKWPNDILIDDLKLSGILVESIYQDKLKALIIGVGINVNNQMFPKEIENRAISLKQACHEEIDIIQLLNDVLKEFEHGYPFYQSNQKNVIDYVNEFLAYKNQEIQYEDNQTIESGQCLNVNDSGQLLIKTKNDIIPLISGVVKKIKKVN